MPGTRQEYWGLKLAANRKRDRRNRRKPRTLGWTVLVVWECEIKALGNLEGRIERFLNKCG